MGLQLVGGPPRPLLGIQHDPFSTKKLCVTWSVARVEKAIQMPHTSLYKTEQGWHPDGGSCGPVVIPSIVTILVEDAFLDLIRVAIDGVTCFVSSFVSCACVHSILFCWQIGARHP